MTRHALSRWETSRRPIRSDDADRVLAACGRDVRFQLVSRYADVDEELDRLDSLGFADRIRQLRLLAPDLLDQLQATGGVVFGGAWAAAALGLPALQDVGEVRVGADRAAQARVAAVLMPWSPLSLAPGGPWGVTWDEEVFVRNPSLRLHTTLLGEFMTIVVEETALELRLLAGDVAWRIVDPSELVPAYVDADVLQRWRLRTPT